MHYTESRVDAEGSVQALVERESEATESQDQEKEIENHPGSLGSLPHECGCAKILESAQIRATFAVPGDQESSALQPEQIP